MSSTVVKIESLSKEYRLGVVGTGALRDDFKRAWCRLRGLEDPFLRVGETNERSVKGHAGYVYALRNINLDIKRGERVGIIGQNGAGKSTLLKILSKVTGPSTGTIKIKGKIGSLLEVGTGFHPELTGRENIYMNGTILGMSKKEIDKKFDEIVQFAGVERYIDTPVKRYSSGMTVRLGFAVAAYLEPDILVVDEVLAVGDAEFQRKAIGKMQEVSNEHGRTILFVSHNLAAVQMLCSKAIVLKNGEACFEGHPEKAVEKYLKMNFESVNNINFAKITDRRGNGDLRVTDFCIQNKNGENIDTVCCGDDVVFKIFFKSNRVFTRPSFTLEIRNSIGVKFLHLANTYTNPIIKISFNINYICCVIKKIPLLPDEYFVSMNVKEDKVLIDAVESIGVFNVIDGDYYGTGLHPDSSKHGILCEHFWTINH